MKKTLENLSKAFIGESQARNRYTLYSKTAKKEGYEQLADIFLVTADNEREHANKFQFDEALEDCSNATNEFNAAKSSADQALTYAKDSNDNVFVTYIGYLVNEIDAKLNATSELQLAIPYM